MQNQNQFQNNAKMVENYANNANVIEESHPPKLMFTLCPIWKSFYLFRGSVWISLYLLRKNLEISHT